MAVVSQDCMLFARSVRENIKYGYEDASDEQMFRAAKQASAHNFILELPQGYDTGRSVGSSGRLPFPPRKKKKLTWGPD